jgi:hypothetical protein
LALGFLGFSSFLTSCSASGSDFTARFFAAVTCEVSGLGRVRLAGVFLTTGSGETAFLALFAFGGASSSSSSSL